MRRLKSKLERSARKQIVMFLFQLFIIIIIIFSIRFGSHRGIDTISHPTEKANMISNSELSMKDYSVNPTFLIKMMMCF